MCFARLLSNMEYAIQVAFEYNFSMTEFNFYHPIEVRYGDLDPQGHVNNASYLTFMEQARISYLRQLGLWVSESFLDVGVVMAEASVSFKVPIHWGQQLLIGVRTSRLGNKSMQLNQTFEDAQSRQELAKGSVVLVAYDYHSERTIPIPENWREIITTFENLPIETK
ncbi:MAG: thioesterase family protein [Anaerolineales bacterium]